MENPCQKFGDGSTYVSAHHSLLTSGHAMCNVHEQHWLMPMVDMVPIRYGNRDYLSTGLPLTRQKKISDFSLTFPVKIADNMSNKCTFINTKSACYNVSVMFQQLTKVNSKC